MGGSAVKGLAGIEDLMIKTSISDTATFERIGSTGSTSTLTKFPVYVGTPAVDPGDITEVISDSSLTHSVLKDKINALLAALRVVGLIE